MRSWTEISPEEARDIVLPHPDIQGPVNEEGQPCPWPWEPQQLKGVPMGMYHCSFCGSMQLAGVPHSDYTGFDEQYAEYVRQQQAKGEDMDGVYDPSGDPFP